MLKPKTRINYTIKIKENERMLDVCFDFDTHEYLLISKYLYDIYLSEFNNKYINLIYKGLNESVSNTDNTYIKLLVHDLINEKHLNREYIILDSSNIEYEWTPDFNEIMNIIITRVQVILMNLNK